VKAVRNSPSYFIQKKITGGFLSIDTILAEDFLEAIRS
jgi:hypothetical protein